MVPASVVGALVALMALSMPAAAASLRLLAGGAAQPVLRAMGPELKAVTGADVEMMFGVVGALQRRLADGEPADVVVLPEPMLAALEQGGKLRFVARRTLARVGIAVVVPAGAGPLPDVASVAAVRSLLARSRSIAHPDPKVTPSGAHFARVFADMGLLAAGGPRVIHRNAIDGGVKLVASGDAEIGLFVVSEVQAEAGVRIAGMLPPELQSYVVYGVAVVAGAGSAAAAVADHLASPRMADRWTAIGFEPVGPSR